MLPDTSTAMGARTVVTPVAFSQAAMLSRASASGSEGWKTRLGRFFAKWTICSPEPPPGVTNVRAPIALDALHSVWPIASADGIICINMVHISPWEATLGLIKGAAAILPPGSPLYLYGPYIRGGFATAPSNQAFDQNLRDRNPNWGLRDLEAVAAMAQSVGFSAPVITEMPANNLSVVFRRM